MEMKVELDPSIVNYDPRITKLINLGKTGKSKLAMKPGTFCLFVFVLSSMQFFL